MKAPLNNNHKGKDFSLAVANRSAALMRLGHLKLALNDVNLAINSGYPKDLKYKLLDRKIKLLKLIGDKFDQDKIKEEYIEAVNDSKLTPDKKEKVINEFGVIATNETICLNVNNKLLCHQLQNSHPLLPTLSRDVEIKYDEKRGRFAVAKRCVELYLLYVILMTFSLRPFTY